MLKRVHIPGYGPFVFGRKKTLLSVAPAFSVPSEPFAVAPELDHDAIRLAAKSLHPIYAAEENILANDSIGDCTCAGALHVTAILQAISGGNWRAPQATDAIRLYMKVTNPPFNPETKANDSGADLGTVLQFWQASGAYSDGTGKIKSFSAVDASNQAAVKAALDKNRNLYLGIGLPDAWIPQNSVPKVWDVAGTPDENNGHCVIAYSYNDAGIQIDSWGCFITITWAAVAKYLTPQGDGEMYTVELA